MNARRFQFASVASLFGFVLVFLAACGPAQQYDPAGQNSGSPQNAIGAFLTDDPNVVVGSIGQPASAYDIFTTATTQFTVTGATTSTKYANQNIGTLPMETGYQLLLVDITLKNVSTGDPKNCPNGVCAEYLSPLSNFRLFDNRNRPWYETTAAAEACTNNFRVACNNRTWSDVSRNGLAVGQSFSTELAFKIPLDIHTYTLYFAPYRYPDSATSGSIATSPEAVSTSGATNTSVPSAGSGSVKSGAPTPAATSTSTVPSRPTSIKVTLNI